MKFSEFSLIVIQFFFIALMFGGIILAGSSSYYAGEFRNRETKGTSIWKNQTNSEMQFIL